jgi:hypothetical protein
MASAVDSAPYSVRAMMGLILKVSAVQCSALLEVISTDIALIVWRYPKLDQDFGV